MLLARAAAVWQLQSFWVWAFVCRHAAKNKGEYLGRPQTLRRCVWTCIAVLEDLCECNKGYYIIIGPVNHITLWQA